MIETCSYNKCNKDLSSMRKIIACKQLYCSAICAIKNNTQEEYDMMSEVISPSDIGLGAM